MSAGCKLGLGTVQFGLDYGLSNTGGQTPEQDVKAVLQRAADAGVRVLDTAAAYGESEAVLGRCVWPEAPFSVVTKTVQPKYLGIDAENLGTFMRSFGESLERLGRPSVYGLLVHDTEDLLKPGCERLYDWLCGLRDEGRVEKIGVSLLSSEQGQRIFERYSLDIVQLPFNVLDRRMERSGLVAELKRANVEIHARSVFLQGVLLMNPGELPPHFDGVKAHLRRYRESLTDAGIPATTAALAFVLRHPAIDIALCGINTSLQLEDLLGVCEWRGLLPTLDEFALDQDEILDPYRWDLSK